MIVEELIAASEALWPLIKDAVDALKAGHATPEQVSLLRSQTDAKVQGAFDALERSDRRDNAHE